jgi:hypothetical protein
MKTGTEWEAHMGVQWPKKLQPKDHVVCPINSAGTTWLKDSDLVFVKNKPYAVLSWSKGEQGAIPEVYIELKPKLLEHDRVDSALWRYQGEIADPTSPRPPA